MACLYVVCCPAATLALVQFFMTHFVEVKRWKDFQRPTSQGEAGTFFGLESSLTGKELCE